MCTENQMYSRFIQKENHRVFNVIKEKIDKVKAQIFNSCGLLEIKNIM